MCLMSTSSTNSAWWCADARNCQDGALLHSIWRCTGHQSPRLHRDSTFVRLLVNSDSAATSADHKSKADERLLPLARRRWTHCQNAYMTPLLVFLFLAVFSKKHSFSRSTSVSSALEAWRWMMMRCINLHYITKTMAYIVHYCVVFVY